MSAYSPPTHRIPSCSSDYPQCEAKAHTLFPLPSHQIKTQNLSFLKRHRQIFSFRVLKRQILLPFAQKQTKTLSVFAVALHPEGVDRNTAANEAANKAEQSPSTRRAWIEMSTVMRILPRSMPSPSTRRAWIEIAIASSSLMMHAMVALHPEGVDRNLFGYDIANLDRGWSPSTRRAWIEIHQMYGHTCDQPRSPSTRRAWIEMGTAKHYGVTPYGRPPPGGRG